MNARVTCPTCGRSIEWSSASPFRPFCSERCKLIDLGAWLAEERGIAGESPSQDADEAANGDDGAPPGAAS